MPQPSSITAASAPKTCREVQNGFVDVEEIHEANKGVIFHSTAPVVPPSRVEESSVGDWWIV